MMDARKPCAELCEVSQLALVLASRGRAAGLHQTPLFSRAGEGAPLSAADAMHERPSPPWGRREATDH